MPTCAGIVWNPVLRSIISVYYFQPCCFGTFCHVLGIVMFFSGSVKTVCIMANL